MANKVHHNIMHFNDIKLLSLDGNVRINTTKQNKVYINSDNSTLTINKIVPWVLAQFPIMDNLGIY